MNANRRDAWRREAGARLREAFLSHLKPDLIWISSLFEGYTDNAITTFKVDSNTPVIVTLYDLIPLLNPAVFLKDFRFKQFYLSQIDQLKQATKCLAISGSSASEARIALKADEDWILELPSGYDLRFRPIRVSVQDQEELWQKLGLTRPFILYVGADDDRKNLPRLIQAYAQLSAPMRQTHQLMIVGKLSLDKSGNFVLKNVAEQAGVSDSELLLIDYVDDDTW